MVDDLAAARNIYVLGLRSNYSAAFYFQYVLHEPPDTTGLYLIASPVTMMVMAPLGGWLSDRSGPRMITAVGLTLEVAVLASLATLAVDTHPLAVSAMLVLMGVALALFNSPNSNACAR